MRKSGKNWRALYIYCGIVALFYASLKLAVYDIGEKYQTSILE